MKLCRRIKEENEIRQDRKVFFSGFQDMRKFRRSVKAGINWFIPTVMSPWTVSDFTRTFLFSLTLLCFFFLKKYHSFFVTSFHGHFLKFIFKFHKLTYLSIHLIMIVKIQKISEFKQKLSADVIGLISVFIKNIMNMLVLGDEVIDQRANYHLQ